MEDQLLASLYQSVTPMESMRAPNAMSRQVSAGVWIRKEMRFQGLVPGDGRYVDPQVSLFLKYIR